MTIVYWLLVLACCIPLGAASAYAGAYVGCKVTDQLRPRFRGGIGWGLIPAIFGGGGVGAVAGIAAGWFVARWMWGG